MENAELQNLLLSKAQSIAPESVLRDKCDRPAITVPAESLVLVLKLFRDAAEFQFDQLIAHTAIDWLAQNQFELVYQLYSTMHRHFAMISVRVSRDNPVVPSVHSVWAVAQWQEREVYDLFGVRYSGHPDLRRILLEDDWIGHPLRKDYKDDFMLERPW